MSLRLLATVIAVGAVVVIAGCAGSPMATATSVPATSPTPEPSPTASAAPTASPTATPMPATGPLYGVSLSPRSFEQEDFLGFFDLVTEAGGTLRWAGDWAEMGQAEGGLVTVVGLKSQFGYEPVYEVNIFRQNPETELLRPLTGEQIDSYVQLAREFAESERPKYLGMGIEVNILYEEMPEEFDKLVDLFDRAATAVKEVSPETQVFTTFQLESMHGLKGGLWGGVDDPAQANWELLDLFPKADFFAFTTYPTLNFKEPAEVPASHYADILEHTGGKKIAFTETGWPAEMDVPGWESDDAEQAEFVERFFELIEPLDPEMVIWSFMFDMQGIDLPEPFLSMALSRQDNTRRPAFDAWVEGVGE